MNKFKAMERLTNQLNKKKISTSVQNSFLELGSNAFDYLSNSIVNRTLSSIQIVNALHIIYFLSREKCYGRQYEVFFIADNLLTDDSIEIRSESALVSTYLAGIFDKFPTLCPEHFNKLKFMLKIKKSLKLGVSDRVKPSVEKYLLESCNEYRFYFSKLSKIFKQYNEFPVSRYFVKTFYINKTETMGIGYDDRSIPRPAVIASVYNKPMNITIYPKNTLKYNIVFS